MLLREWRRYTDLEEDKQEWTEDHILVEEDTYRWVEVQRGEKGVLDISTYHYPDGQASEPGPMTLHVGLTWGKRERVRVLGVSRVRIGERTWKCLKVSDQVTEGGDEPTVLTEWYVAESGRTVFFRRYNAPGWREPEQPGSYEALKGNLEVEYEGVRYRHWYDCIPDHALERVLG
jgi:hypothetical protein